jgi:hypothetical protein
MTRAATFRGSGTAPRTTPEATYLDPALATFRFRQRRFGWLARGRHDRREALLSLTGSIASGIPGLPKILMAINTHPIEPASA